MIADERREFDAPWRLPQAERVEAVAFHAIREAIVGLEIIGHGVAVTEGIALVVIVSQIFGKLVIHLELEASRKPFLHAQRQAPEERLGGAFERRQLADTVRL